MSKKQWLIILLTFISCFSLNCFAELHLNVSNFGEPVIMSHVAQSPGVNSFKTNPDYKTRIETNDNVEVTFKLDYFTGGSDEWLSLKFEGVNSKKIFMCTLAASSTGFIGYYDFFKIKESNCGDLQEGGPNTLQLNLNLDSTEKNKSHVK